MQGRSRKKRTNRVGLLIYAVLLIMGMLTAPAGAALASGISGETVAVQAPQRSFAAAASHLLHVEDKFLVQRYDQNNGQPGDSWETSWIENDVVSGGAGPSAGNVLIFTPSGGFLTLRDNPNTDTDPSAAREVDLSGGYTSATLSFRFLTTSGVDTGDHAVVEISSDGGANYTVLETFQNVSGVRDEVRNIDITSFISADTRVRFRIDQNYGGDDEYFAVDYVKIEATRPITGGVIGDRVWYDLNGNGSQDGGEVGINGVTVNLYNGSCGSGSPTSAVTSGDGNYLFHSLSAGTYCVDVDETTLPEAGVVNYTNIGGSDPATVSINTDEQRDNVDFGYRSNNQCLPKITFDQDALSNVIPVGATIAEQWAGWGVHITAVPAGSGTGPAMAFGSSTVPPGSEDVDLGSPNEAFSGPGIGSGGGPGPGANQNPLGNVLIISEDGSSSNPDDNGSGGQLIFTFDQPQRIDLVEILDIDDDEAGGPITAYDATSGGNVVGQGQMLGLGSNSFQRVSIGATGARRLVVDFPSSGAMPAIVFCGTPPPAYDLGDRIWEDLNQDGIQNDGATGINGVKLELYLGNTLVDTKTTSGDGNYLFEDLPPGNFRVKVSDENFDAGGALAGLSASPVGAGNDPGADSDFDGVDHDAAVSIVDQNILFIDGGFFENPNVCYAVSDSTDSAQDSDQLDTLVFLDRTTGATTSIGIGEGNTGENNIEAIAFRPGGDTLYAADANQLGTLNLFTGVFTPVSSNNFGNAEGFIGGNLVDENINDVDGLSFDPTTGILYGSERRGGNDVLVQIDPATGLIVQDAFSQNGQAVDFVVIQTVTDPDGNELDDVDDIAIDPVTGQMYMSVNEGGSSLGYLVTVDKATGAVSNPLQIMEGQTSVQDVEGLSFFNDGNLYGSSGKSGPTENGLFQIDLTTAQATHIGQFTPSSLIDFEALACLTAPASINLEKSTNGEDADDPTGPQIAAGSEVTWDYEVTNTGGVTLVEVTITDDKEGQICVIQSLAPAETKSCQKKGVAQTGQYANLGTAVGKRQDNNRTVEDTDPSHYFGTGGNPDYVITKTYNTDPQLDGVRTNTMISFTIMITNTGDRLITKLPLIDDFDPVYIQFDRAEPVHNSTSSGQIVWDDLTAAGSNGFGQDLAPGQSFSIVVHFLAIEDTLSLPNQVTINTATVRGGEYDPDNNGNPPYNPLPEKSDDAPAKIEFPTAVSLASSALNHSDGQVAISWQTVNEAEIARFRVYRIQDGGAPQMIAEVGAQRPGAAEGAVYEVMDSVSFGSSYEYRLEVENFNGGLESTSLGSIFAGTSLYLPSVASNR